MSRPTVLLVEDDRFSRTTTAQLLLEAGFEVRVAAGAEDLERKVRAEPGFLSGLSLLILDIELYESLGRNREDKGGTHTGMAMTGSQLGVSLGLAFSELRTVPFLLYSARDPRSVQESLEELRTLAEAEDLIRQNYRGFVAKDERFPQALLEKVRAVLACAG